MKKGITKEKYNMKALMITAASSNSGKTLVTVGIIRALKNRNIDVSPFKSGPDFIDGKYISAASGKNAGNLDMHLMGKKGVKEALYMNPGELAIVEGAMGYFDGIHNTYENSSFHISEELDIPAILVYCPEGEMFSAIPKIKGMVDFSKGRVKGIILNKTDEYIYKLLKEKIEEYTGIEVLGYLPDDDGLFIDSKHLGLVRPDKNSCLTDLIRRAADLTKKNIDLDRIIDIGKEIGIEKFEYPTKRDIKVAIAYDEAFNFYYEENIRLLDKICEIEYFSPIKDKKTPESDLIYIGGGYPELYKKQLSDNHSMISSIKNHVDNNKHLFAEGGGLMYMSEKLEGHPMCSVLEGETFMTDELQNFGYTNMELLENTILGTKGSTITGKEFHRSVLETDMKGVFNITKPKSKKSRKSGYRYKNALCMYQHINFLGNMKTLDYLLGSIELHKRGV